MLLCEALNSKWTCYYGVIWCTNNLEDYTTDLAESRPTQFSLSFDNYDHKWSNPSAM